MFTDLAEHIRFLTERATNEHDPEEADAADITKANSVHWITWLGRLATAHSTEEFNRRAWEKTLGRGGHYARQVGNHGRFEADYLMQSLRVLQSIN